MLKYPLVKFYFYYTRILKILKLVKYRFLNDFFSIIVIYSAKKFKFTRMNHFLIRITCFKSVKSFKARLCLKTFERLFAFRIK